MRLIKPSCEVWEQGPGIIGVNKMIERCGRVCYKSEDKVTEDSCFKFVEMLANRQHGAMLEFGTVYLKYKLSSGDWDKGDDMLKFWMTQKYSNVNTFVHEDENGVGFKTMYITTNFRVIHEYNRHQDMLDYMCEPTEFHEPRITAYFTVDRGVSHELVRHRTFSWAQESTRYCNYGKDRFGNAVTFIIPNWLDNVDFILENMPDTAGEQSSAFDRWWDAKQISTGDYLWLDAMLSAEAKYKTFVGADIFDFASALALSFQEQHEEKWERPKNDDLLNIDTKGKKIRESSFWQAQQARSVLPNSLATSIVACAFLRDWKHFFGLRDAAPAHPQMKEVAAPLHTLFKTLGYLK